MSPTTDAAPTRIDKMYIQTASGYRPVDNTYHHHLQHHSHHHHHLKPGGGGDPESNKYDDPICHSKWAYSSVFSCFHLQLYNKNCGPFVLCGAKLMVTHVQRVPRSAGRTRPGPSTADMHDQTVRLGRSVDSPLFGLCGSLRQYILLLSNRLYGFDIR